MDRLGQVLVETYRVERLIAEGGMAAVYEATHLRVPKRFAVKFLKMSLVNNTEALLRFRREAEIIATFDHPNIVQLVDYNVTDDGQPYIVLEFLDGEHLGVRILAGKLALDETLRIAGRVAAALTVAHARDITHRDLKPENIILCKDDQVKVVDFGVAKLRHGPELTAMNVVVGTVGFMSPEQISGGSVDPRTDQFALASIIYSMLSGKPAFALQGSVAAQAMAILHHEPEPIAGMPEAVHAALLRGMAKNPFHRFANVTELMQALHVAAGGTAEVAADFDRGPTTDPNATADLDGLPELPGDATSVTTMPVAPAAVALPEPAVPTPLQAARTLQMDAVPAEIGAELAAARAQAAVPIAERATLPPTMLPPMVLPPMAATPNPLPARSERATMPPAIAHPAARPTVKSMSAVGPGENTGVFRAPAAARRWRWIAVGAAVGSAIAVAAWLLVR